MKRIFGETLVLSSHQFTDKTSCHGKNRMFLKFRHLGLVLTALPVWLPISLLAQTKSDESTAKVSAVRVPFVGCKSDGQVGPQPAPKGSAKTVWLDTAAFRMLAYYKSDSSIGVLAPRGWHGFGGYGTSGSNLTVVPHPLKSFDDLGKDITGPGIQVYSISGEMSGRFEVARVIARVFPTQRAFTESIIKEDTRPESDFPFGPYPKDELTYRSDLVVQFQTPPHTKGLGTEFGLTPNDEPINGVVIMQGVGAEESPSLEFLIVRLMPDNGDLTAQIVQQFERDCAAPEPK
jgi:hypothetical protein